MFGCQPDKHGAEESVSAAKKQPRRTRGMLGASRPLTQAEEEVRIAELLARPPEQTAAERAELERHTEEMRAHVARGGSLDDPEREIVDEEIAVLAGRVLAQAADARRMRLELPCYRAMYPSGNEPDGIDPRAWREEDPVGRAACEAAGWYREHGHHGDPDHRLPCMRGMREDNCPRARVRGRIDQVRERLDRAHVPGSIEQLATDAGFVFSVVTGKLRPSGLRTWPISGPVMGQYLDRLDSVRVIREVARRSSCSLEDLENAGERMSGGRARPVVVLRGDERIVALGGNKGRGKSTAAQLLLALEGGLYTTEYDFGRPKKDGGVDVVEAIARAGVLVIDQFGRANRGESHFLLQQVEEVIDKRKAAGRRTVIVGNFTYELLEERYGNRAGDGTYVNLILDRILGHGVLIEFGGESLREHLRETKGEPA